MRCTKSALLQRHPAASNTQATSSYHTKNEDDENKRNNIRRTRNKEDSFDYHESFSTAHSYDSRDPPESSFPYALGHDQQTSSPFSSSGHLLEPIPYNPNSNSHYDYTPSHALDQHHHNNHINSYDAPAQEESFYVRSSNYPATHDFHVSRYSHSSSRPHYYSRGDRESSIDLYEEECRQPPSPSYNQISIEPVDDYHYYSYNNNQY
jgi:hypothetical protein